GLGIIVTAAGYGAIPTNVAIWIGAVIVTIYVVTSGIRGSAYTAVVKDILILGVVLFLGIYLPLHLYGGVCPMFEKIAAAKPGFLVFPASGQSVAWFVSTVLLTAVGFFMWPHSFSACYSAKDPRGFRRNAIALPIYQLILLFVFFVGFAAVLQVPGLKGGDTNLALFKLAAQQFPPAIIGLIGAAGVFTALVPGSLIAMTAAMLLAKNLIGLLRPEATDAQTVALAKWLVPVVMLVAVYFTLTGNATIVAMLLVGYSFVTQLFPAVVVSLMPRNPATPAGAFAGILVGALVAAVLTFTHATIGSLFPALPEAIRDLNVASSRLPRISSHWSSSARRAGRARSRPGALEGGRDRQRPSGVAREGPESAQRRLQPSGERTESANSGPSPTTWRTGYLDPKHAFPSWTRYGRSAPESCRRLYGKDATKQTR
ncbi:MAG TPA: hypothetical protein VNY10_01835, partial [Roseiarcus sp.]|nr:hypothetical protein [Roseiarcus sp.]